MCHYGNLAHFSRPVPQFRTDFPYGRNLAQLEEAVLRAMERNLRSGHSRFLFHLKAKVIADKPFQPVLRQSEFGTFQPSKLLTRPTISHRLSLWSEFGTVRRGRPSGYGKKPAVRPQSEFGTVAEEGLKHSHRKST